MKDADSGLESNPKGGMISSKVPGTETIYIKTWGCSHNNSDGEYMAGLLAAYGYTVTTGMLSSGTAHVFFGSSPTRFVSRVLFG